MQFLINILSALAIISSILVITRKNPVHSVLFLISVFINVSGYLLLLGISYIGLAYIIIYVGAIAILFLFVIMMLNLRLIELVESRKEYTKNLPIATSISLFFIIILYNNYSLINNYVRFTSTIELNTELYSDQNYIIWSWLNKFINTSKYIRQENFKSLSMNSLHNENIRIAFNSNLRETVCAPVISFLHVQSIGQGLYTYSALMLIITSLIFLLAMIGPIVLCLEKK